MSEWWVENPRGEGRGLMDLAEIGVRPADAQSAWSRGGPVIVVQSAHLPKGAPLSADRAQSDCSFSYFGRPLVFGSGPPLNPLLSPTLNIACALGKTAKDPSATNLKFFPPLRSFDGLSDGKCQVKGFGPRSVSGRLRATRVW